MMTLLDSRLTMETLAYLGWTDGSVKSAIKVTKPKDTNPRHFNDWQSQRRVYRIAVIGPKGSGKVRPFIFILDISFEEIC